MINFEHDKTLIVGEDRVSQIGPFTKATIYYTSARSVEWKCQFCGASGPGFPPEHHASGACEATRTIVPPPGYMDGGGI